MNADQREKPTAEQLKYMVVTPQQFANGYLEFDGFIARHRNYQKIKTLPDGTTVVINPRKD